MPFAGCHMLEQQEKNSKQGYSSDYSIYKTLFESINAAAFIISLDGKIIESNIKSYDLSCPHSSC